MEIKHQTAYDIGAIVEIDVMPSSILEVKVVGVTITISNSGTVVQYVLEPMSEKLRKQGNFLQEEKHIRRFIRNGQPFRLVV